MWYVKGQKISSERKCPDSGSSKNKQELSQIRVWPVPTADPEFSSPHIWGSFLEMWSFAVAYVGTRTLTVRTLGNIHYIYDVLLCCVVDSLFFSAVGFLDIILAYVVF